MSIRDEVLKENGSQICRYSFTSMDEILLRKHGQQWKRYRKLWDDSKNIGEETTDIPLYILLELNSFCNLKCKMCKHADDGQNIVRESMPMPVFEKIIRECRVLGIPSINIGSGTECTLHPRFKDIVLMVKESGAIDKFFLTNGSTLSENMINDLFQGEYERVEISVDAATKETYQKIRKNGNFEKLETAIAQLVSEKKKRGLELPLVRLSFCVQNENIDEIDLFYEKWKNHVDLIEFQKVSQPCEFISKTDNGPMIETCTQPFNRMTINYKGDIFACCSILYQDSYCLGNIRDMTIYDAWHCDRMQAIRAYFRNGKLMEHCKRCLISIYGEKNNG